MIALDAALTATGRQPILDLVASGTLKPELLVGEDGAEAIAKARAEAGLAAEGAASAEARAAPRALSGGRRPGPRRARAPARSARRCSSGAGCT